MELRHLRYFRRVAEELNLTRAAERLCISQPPLTRQIKQLEAELGLLLFERTPRGLAITPAGRYFHEQAIEILDRVDAAAAGARSLANSGRSTLRLGFVPSFLYEELPTVIQHLRTRHDVELALTELLTVEQVHALKSHRIDVGFGRLIFDDPAIVQEVLFEEPLIAVLPVGHHLAGTDPTLGALAAEPLIVYPDKPRPSYADTVLALFQSHGIAVTVAQEVNGLQTALGMVASGMGVTLVPERVRRLGREGVEYRPLADRSLTSPILLSRRREPCPELIADLYAIVRRLVGERTRV